LATSAKGTAMTSTLGPGDQEIPSHTVRIP